VIAFLDATVFVAGAHAGRGWAELMQAAATRCVRLVTTRLVLAEADRHVSESRYAGATERLDRLRGEVEVVPFASRLENWALLVVEREDAHVYAAAVGADADFLVTANLRHFARAAEVRARPRVVNTPEFVRALLAA